MSWFVTATAMKISASRVSISIAPPTEAVSINERKICGLMSCKPMWMNRVIASVSTRCQRGVRYCRRKRAYSLVVIFGFFWGSLI